MDNLKSQGTKAFFWDFTGKLAQHGMGFVVSIFLARLLEPSDFGLVAMVMVIIGIAGVFMDVGLGSALIQRRKVHSIHYASVFYFNLAVGLSLTLLIFFSASKISNFYGDEALLPLAQVMSFAFVINAFGSVQSVKLRKELNYVLLTKINVKASLLSGVIGISLAVWGAGVWSLVAQTLSQGIIYNIFIWFYGGWRPVFAFSWKALDQLWGFGFRMFLSTLLDTVFTRLDTMIIGKLFPSEILGFFNRAKSLDNMVIMYTSGSLMSVLFPILSKVQNNLTRYQNIVKKSLGILVFVLFFLLGGLYLVSHELVMLLFGAKWKQSVEYFQVLVLGGFGYPISALLVSILSSRGNSRAFLRLEIYKKILMGLNLGIGFLWGIEGYLYGLVIVAMGAVYLNVLFASREIQMAKMEFINPIMVQGLLTVVIVNAIMIFNQNMQHSLIVMFLLKGIEFLAAYLIVNWVVRPQAYDFFMVEARSIFFKLLSRKRR